MVKNWIRRINAIDIILKDVRYNIGASACLVIAFEFVNFNICLFLMECINLMSCMFNMVKFIRFLIVQIILMRKKEILSFWFKIQLLILLLFMNPYIFKIILLAYSKCLYFSKSINKKFIFRAKDSCDTRCISSFRRITWKEYFYWRYLLW